MINREKIGDQLKELRLSRGWTQATVADRVNLSRPTISNIEAGRRTMTLSTLKRFCEIYQIDISYFGIETESYEETLDLTTRLEKIFTSDLDEKKKDDLYLQIMQIYLDSKKAHQ